MSAEQELADLRAELQAHWPSVWETLNSEPSAVTREWGVRLDDGRVTTCASREMARAIARMTTKDGRPYRPGAVVVWRTQAPWIEDDS